MKEAFVRVDEMVSYVKFMLFYLLIIDKIYCSTRVHWSTGTCMNACYLIHKLYFFTGI